MNGSLGSIQYPPATERTSNNVCLNFLTEKVRDSSVRILDLCFFQPAVIFLIYLTLSACNAARRLWISPNLIVWVTYIATFSATVINCIRPIVNVLLHSYGISSEIPDKVTELLLFSAGCVNSRRYKRLSDKSIIVLSITVSLLHGLIQGCVDLTSVSPSDVEYILGFGGIHLAICTSAVCFMLYLYLLIMLTMRRNLFFNLPAYFHLTRASVYVYCLFLLAVYSPSLFGGIAFVAGQTNGLCAIAFSSFLYYLFYAPLVYVLFLRGYFSSRKGHLAFLYRSDLYRSQEVGLSVNSGDIRVPSYSAVSGNSDPPTPLPVPRMLAERCDSTLPPPARNTSYPATAFIPDSRVSTKGGADGEDVRLDWASGEFLVDRGGNCDEDVSPILPRVPGACSNGDGLPKIGELLADPERLLSAEDDEDFYTGQPDPALFEAGAHH
ncbi:Transmembrane protein adipocyte-associated 1 [Sparganum proliferum]